MNQPPFQITSKILNLAAEIQTLLGEFKSLARLKPPLKLRKENKIKTIHHSLAIEGSSLSEEQITALMESKRVLGPKKQIIEVQNALRLYDLINHFDPFKEKDFLKAHQILMKDLIEKPGSYRKSAVGIFKGNQVTRMAPPDKRVPELMETLFYFLKSDKETLNLIKACVFHYEVELIHPFLDGNGRMGRLWQQLILMKSSSVFEYLPVESLIHRYQKEYYKSLEVNDKKGESTPFIEFSLEMILRALHQYSPKLFTTKPKISDRIELALEHFGSHPFSRKDYLLLHKGLSAATASRDLAKAVSEKKMKLFGTKARATYRKINT